MIFRVEDISNPNGNHRKYNIPLSQYPKMALSNLSRYIPNEIRKEVNNSSDRRLLSYSKSLIICLMKYNQYSDNELHINIEISPDNCDFIIFQYDKKIYNIPFNLNYDLSSITDCLENEIVILFNFTIDISNNQLLDIFLNDSTGTHKKKIASPEKDHEILLFQSPNDLILTQYLQQAYVLLALSIRYGLPSVVAKYIIREIKILPEYRFASCSQEREALIYIVYHIYQNLYFEKQVLKTIKEDELLRICYDSIFQFKSIIDREIEFDELYSDDSFYNCNVVSDIIFNAYSRYLGYHFH